MAAPSLAEMELFERLEKAGERFLPETEPEKKIMAEADEVLMARVGRGDREACSKLVERHLARMVAFASRVLGNRAEGEEVAQEVFLRLWAGASRWRQGRARLTTWLYRVALNLCLTRLAHRSKKPLDDLAGPADHNGSVAARVHEKEIGRIVNREMLSLPERQRFAITLCYYQGLGNIEAAEVMEVSVEALESLLSRGRRKLRQRLGSIVPDLLG